MGKNAKRRKAAKDRAAVERRWGTRAEYSPEGRKIHFTEESGMPDMLRAQMAAFEEKFGRPPGPTDPIVFDPDADTPQPLTPAKVEAGMVEVMRQANLDPAYIYAFQQTGLMVTEMNEHLLSEEDIAEFEEAMDRYRELHPDDE